MAIAYLDPRHTTSNDPIMESAVGESLIRKQRGKRD